MSKKVIDFGYYEVTTKPAGFWRNFLRDILPYWQGTIVKFETELKAIRDIPSKHHFLIVQLYQNPNAGNPIKLTDRIYMENVKEGDTKNIPYETKHLFDTGDVFLVIHSYDISMEANPKANIYSFHVTNRSWFFFAIIAGAIAGITSYLLNLLIGC